VNYVNVIFYEHLGLNGMKMDFFYDGSSVKFQINLEEFFQSVNISTSTSRYSFRNSITDRKLKNDEQYLQF